MGMRYRSTDPDEQVSWLFN